ncbi:hypothetical protein SAMN06265347_11120 [Halobellus salinus]|nr:hypothetical protein SAMN06265347_11120 [Halobellus salinus]
MGAGTLRDTWKNRGGNATGHGRFAGQSLTASTHID